MLKSEELGSASLDATMAVLAESSGASMLDSLSIVLDGLVTICRSLARWIPRMTFLRFCLDLSESCESMSRGHTEDKMNE